jgi:hypothetical protein
MKMCSPNKKLGKTYNRNDTLDSIKEVICRINFLQMRESLLFIVCFLSTYCFSQNVPDRQAIEKRILKEHPNCIVPDSSSFFINGYLHLDGKIGNATASIEVNIFPNRISSYLFSDSLQGIIGLETEYVKGILHFGYDEYKFVGGIKAIDEIYLAITKDTSFVGYVKTNNKLVPCNFKEKFSTASIGMRNLNFKYQAKVNNFPTLLYGNLLFADTASTSSKLINNNLLDFYDGIGLNYQDEVGKMSFKELDYLKTRKTYRAYCVAKFKKVCAKIINKEFIENAKESGHTDIYENGLNAEVLCNDGRFLVIQSITTLADGNAYPYYETGLIEFDLVNNKIIDVEKNATIDNESKSFNSIKNGVIAKLITAKVLDTDKGGLDDEFFLSSPRVAFKTTKGYVLVRQGGNHGIHNFYKFYRKDIIQPLLAK